MKVILTEKITKLGNIGDTVEVKTGFARNYLLPNKKALRFTKENVALFEAQKAELIAKKLGFKLYDRGILDGIANEKNIKIEYSKLIQNFLFINLLSLVYYMNKKIIGP